MGERTEIISNASGIVIIAVLTALVLHSKPALPGPVVGPGEPVEISLEAAPEEPKEQPKEESAAAPPPASEEVKPPEEVTPPPPPPPPPPPEETAPIAETPAATPTEEASVVPPEPLVDPDGVAAAQQQAREAAREKEASAFRTCLQKSARYPSSKEARKLKPHGTVVLEVHVQSGAIGDVIIVKSSGSTILDEAAKASVLKSGCGKNSESSILSGSIAY
ncbi:TonB family protein [Rhodomicrobium vannielii ATCC 17100]|uniref:TonB family protein n=1 Tax=Rhodomicrobium vannielii TaxID=1069 RepID=UPI0019188308|nr:TonB family protein [Rhodomicrobium vannielii]MBJ7532740.1 TonB family protein [Rhodomicrobium vannielii ATCC 17100]